MHPVPTKALPKEHFEATVTLFLIIGPETERIGISECESVSYVFLWVFVGAGEPFLGKITVVDLECDCVVWCVLISKIHLTKFWGIPKARFLHIRISIVIGIPQDQIDGH